MLKSISRVALAAGALFAATGMALAGPAVTRVQTNVGEALADARGMVLYTYRHDTAGVSNCYNQCAVAWPPFYAQTGDTPSGSFTLVERNDGTVMWAKDGMPLYYWVNDTRPGQAGGEGLGGVWDVARP